MLRKVLLFFLLILLCSLLVSGVIAYMRVSDAAWLASQVQILTRQYVGFDVDIQDGVKMDFSSRPVLVLGNVRVTRLEGGLSASIDKVQIVPVFSALIRGELDLKVVNVIAPKISLDMTKLSTQNDTKEHSEETIPATNAQIKNDIEADYNLSEKPITLATIVPQIPDIISIIHDFIAKSPRFAFADIHIQNADVEITLADSSHIMLSDLYVEADANAQNASFKSKTASVKVDIKDIGLLEGKAVEIAMPRLALFDNALKGDIALDIEHMTFHENRIKNSFVIGEKLHLALDDCALTKDLVRGHIVWKANILNKLKAIPHFDLYNDVNMDFAYSIAKGSVSLSKAVLGIKGIVELKGYKTPLDLHIPFAWDNEQVLHLSKARIALDNDSLTLSGKGKELFHSPEFTGTVDLHHLSLPRWFGFARHLPNGLQNALDNLVGGFDFTVNEKHLVVPRLQATVCGLPLKGTAGIADFSYPDLLIDVAGPYLNANKVIPEINNEWPKAPYFSMEPLLAVPDGEVEADDGIDHFGYDIRVHAEDVDAYVLSLHKLNFRCSPSEEGTLLAFKSPDIYNGIADLYLDITDGYVLTGTVKDISLAEPITELAGWPALSGIGQMEFDIKAPFNRTLKTVLDDMRGHLIFSAENGAVLINDKPDTKPFLFSSGSLDGTIEKAGAKPENAEPSWLSYDGQWKGHWEFPNGEKGRYEFDGVVHFDFDTALPVAFTSVPVHIHAFLPESVSSIPHGITTDFHAIASAHLYARWLTFEQIQGSNRGISFTGNTKVEGIGGPMRWQGKFEASHPSIRELLKTADISVWPTRNEQAFGPVRLLSNFTYAGGVLSLYKAQFFMDGSRYGGNVRYVDASGTSPRPLVLFDITVDSFDMDSYLLQKADDKSPPSESPWDLSSWRACDIDGHISFGNLSFYKQKVSHVTAPVLLNNGFLSIEDMRATLGKGWTTMALRIDASEKKTLVKDNLDENNAGLFAELAFNARDINTQNIVQSFTSEDYFAGTMDCSVLLDGHFASDGDVLKALNGQWHLAVKDGYLSRSGQGENKEKRISFSLLTGSGTVDEGRVQNSDFIMNSLLLKATGHGWLELATKAIHYMLDISFARVPNIPVLITGTLDKPDITVQGVGIVLGTIENIGTSIFDIASGILLAPFDFLGLTRSNEPLEEGTTNEGVPLLSLPAMN